MKSELLFRVPHNPKTPLERQTQHKRKGVYSKHKMGNVGICKVGAWCTSKNAGRFAINTRCVRECASAKRCLLCLLLFVYSLFLTSLQAVEPSTPNRKLTRPIFIYAEGTYYDFATIAFRVAEQDITIRYTTDNTPVNENSPLYISAFRIKQDTIVRARAYRHNWIESDEIIQEYIITNVPQDATLLYQKGIVNVSWKPPKSIINTEWRPIYYESIGNIEPDEALPLYEEKLITPGSRANTNLNIVDPYQSSIDENIKYHIFLAKIDETTHDADPPEYIQLTEIAVSDTMFSFAPTEAGLYQLYIQATSEFIEIENLNNTSEIFSIFIKQISPATISPAPGLYYEPIQVSLEHHFPQTDIHYTLDGSTPDQTSPKYNSPLRLNKHTDTTINYRVYHDDYIATDPETAIYKITDYVTPPLFEYPTGLYFHPFYLHLFCQTENALIFYTLDGSEPNRNSQIYVNPILIDQTTTIKAQASKPNWGRSAVFSADYEIIDLGTDAEVRPLGYETRLLKPHPNPFSTSTNIGFMLKNEDFVDLHIYNILGQTVRTLVAAKLDRGEHYVSWDGRNLQNEEVANGVYFCHFKTSDYVEVMKIIYAQ